MSATAPPPPFDSRPWRSVSGGNLNHAARVETADGSAFLKWNDAAPPGAFAAEACGLELLAEATGGAGVPRVLDVTEHWLLLEWIEPGSGGPATDEHAGRLIARVHAHTRATFGLDHENFIGRMLQPAGAWDDWTEFWLGTRIEPALAVAGFDPTDSRRILRAAERVAQLCPDEPPRLTHGDLWAGNLLAATGGGAWLVDPAVGYSHRETDLALMRLFGGFGPECWRAYDAELPIAEGFDERCPGLQLHPLLLHAGLFGGRYHERVLDAARRFA